MFAYTIYTYIYTYSHSVTSISIYMCIRAYVKDGPIHTYTQLYLYWTNWSEFSPRILKTSVDGQNSTILANSAWVTWPNALAIDYTNQVLCWGDAQRDVIGRMNTDGSGIEIITNLMQTPRSNSQAWGYNGYIYWSD